MQIRGLPVMDIKLAWKNSRPCWDIRIKRQPRFTSRRLIMIYHPAWCYWKKRTLKGTPKQKQGLSQMDKPLILLASPTGFEPVSPAWKAGVLGRARRWGHDYLKISAASYGESSTVRIFYLFLFRSLTPPQAAVIALAVCSHLWAVLVGRARLERATLCLKGRYSTVWVNGP